MKFIISISSILVIILSGCSQSGELQQFELKPAGKSLRIPIPSTSNSTSRNVRYFKDHGEEYLAIENGQNRTISIYSLSDCSYVKDVAPQVQGPNGINGKMHGFDIVNLDTIFVSVNGFGDHFFMIDSDANLKKEFSFEVKFEPFVALPVGFRSNFGRNVWVSNGKIFTGNVCRDAKENFLKMHEHSIGYCYDMEKDTLYDDPRHYPDISSINPSVELSESSFIVNGDKIILSYNSGHQLFVCQDSTWEVHNIRSKYIDREFDKREVAPPDVQTAMTIYATHSEYRVLFYDKNRDVYYRIAYPGIDVTPQDDVMMLGEFRRIFSVMIIDKDFNVIGETLMPEKIYNVNMFFVNEEGLWFSTNNIENPNFEEDAINFELFELK